MSEIREEKDKGTQERDALVQDGSDMIESSAEDIEASLRAIASLDVEGLNESIRALEAVTTAMGRLFGYQSEN